MGRIYNLHMDEHTLEASLIIIVFCQKLSILVKKYILLFSENDYS